jgi:hypothetical protein
MVYAVQGFFGFRNITRRDAVMQNVQTRLAQEITWGEVTTQALTTMEGDPGMTVEVRFTTAEARDLFWTDVIAFMGTGLNGPVAGSYIDQHDCPHDGTVGRLCLVRSRIDY